MKFTDLNSAYRWLDQHINHERNLGKINYDARTFELEEFRRMLMALGETQRGRRSVHIAGTRGKGSVTLALEALLLSQGFRTAAYLSPHLTEYRERVRLSGRMICETDFCRHLESVASVSRHRGGPSEKPGEHGFKTVFEHLTALFFLAARDHDADWMIVETGLGGRLDATNVLDPGPVVLTRIGLEHTQLLGATHEAIAAEKAAILKSGGWGIAGAQDPGHGAMNVFEARARSVDADLLQAMQICPVMRKHFHADGMELSYEFQGAQLELDLPHFGPFLAENLQNALAMFAELVNRGCVPSPDRVGMAAALRCMQLPGRMEQLAPIPVEDSMQVLRLFADSGHCPSGGNAIAEAMQAHFPGESACAVVGMADDKNHAGFFQGLARWNGWCRLIVYRLNSVRAAEPGHLAGAARPYFSWVEEAKDLTEALQFAMLNAVKYHSVVAAGSAYSISAARQWREQHGR